MIKLQVCDVMARRFLLFGSSFLSFRADLAVSKALCGVTRNLKTYPVIPNLSPIFCLCMDAYREEMVEALRRSLRYSLLYASVGQAWSMFVADHRLKVDLS